MVRDLDAARRLAWLDPHAEHLLARASAPIVLLRERRDSGLAGNIAPGLGEIGVMIAYTPLHRLLLDGPLDCLVMTSGNLTDEPIARSNDEARERLGAIADGFLMHNREVLQRCDDSVLRWDGCAEVMLRRSRGYVPEGIRLPFAAPESVLAMGGDLKNTCAIVRGDMVYPGQHVGDLAHPDALAFHGEVVRHLKQVLDVRPEIVAHDSHPGYHSTRLAGQLPARVRHAVQHHHAHLAAVLAEHGVRTPSVGIILDGTGYGPDGTIWGGELLLGDLTRFRRLARLRPFPLPGGDAAVKEPWRTAVMLLDQAFGVERAEELIPHLPLRRSRAERDLLRSMVEAGVNTAVTSSCGRLFDGVAALLGLVDAATYEAEAPMKLEAAANSAGSLAPDTPPPVSPALAEFPSGDGMAGGGPVFAPCRSLDTRPLVRQVALAVTRGASVSEVARLFHEHTARLLADAAIEACRDHGRQVVCLGGGVFANLRLRRGIASRLQQAGLRVLVPRLLPPGDGGLAVGQAAIAAARLLEDASQTVSNDLTLASPCA